MSRHRRVRNMSYGEDDDYDEYGRSLDDDELVSPSTAAQFMYQRDQHKNPSLLSYFDGRDGGTTTASAIVSPVSPLTTNVAMAAPPGKVEDRADESTAVKWGPQKPKHPPTTSIRVTSEDSSSNLRVSLSQLNALHSVSASKGLSLSDLAKTPAVSGALQSRSPQPYSGGPSLSDLAAQHSIQGGGGARLPGSQYRPQQPSLSSLASLRVSSDSPQQARPAGVHQPAVDGMPAVHIARHKAQSSAVESPTTSTPLPSAAPFTSTSSSSTISLSELAGLHTAIPRGSVSTPDRCSNTCSGPAPSLSVACTATGMSVSSVSSTLGMSAVTHSRPSSGAGEHCVDVREKSGPPTSSSATTPQVHRPKASSSPSLSDLASAHRSTFHAFPTTTIPQVAPSHVPSSAAPSPSPLCATAASVSSVATLHPGTFSTSSSSSSLLSTPSPSSVTPPYMQTGSGRGQHLTTGTNHEHSGFTFSTLAPKSKSPQLSLSDLVRLHSVSKDPQSEGREQSATGRLLAQSDQQTVHPVLAVEHSSLSIPLTTATRHQPSLADLANMKKWLSAEEISPHPPPGLNSAVALSPLLHSNLQSSKLSPITAHLVPAHRLHLHPKNRATTAVSALPLASDHCGRGGAMLVASPSLYGVTVCRTAHLCKEGVAYREVSRTHQLVVKGLVTAFHSQCAFNFSSASPDDEVKQKQTEGFTGNGTPTKVKVGSKASAKIGFTSPTFLGEEDRASNPTSPARTPSPSPTPHPPQFQRSISKSKYQQIDVISEYREREKNGKRQINLVVVGHVDAGKSTLMGHLLYLLGNVTKRVLHKYEVESQKVGKSSFAFAWVLDETGEERSRGVTMDVAQQEFETEHRQVMLLDAPGHRDFIPNMITGAAQADVAILVVDATTGEFEAGFEAGGQTREHALLVRSLGVKQLAVAVNKMDTAEWSQERFDEIVTKLKQFLKQAGFRDSDVSYVPCSGLTGENLVKPSTLPQLTSWYRGPTLLDRIDHFTPPVRPVDKPFRCCVADIFKAPGSGFNVAGRIESGHVQLGENVLVLPAGEIAVVKSVLVSDRPGSWAVAGDQVIMTLQGVEMNKLSIGNVVCSVDSPAKVTSRIEARIIIFNIEIPITIGFPVVMHYQSVNEPASVKKLICLLHKSSGELLKRKPRCLTKNSTAVIELEIARPVCMELYQDCRELGRFMLRSGGGTIAAGVVTKVL